MKQPKSEVNYSPGHKESHCGPTAEKDAGYCRFFIKPPDVGFKSLGHCRKVAGPIARGYWCNRWEAK